MISSIFSCMDRENNLIRSLKSWTNTKLINEFVVVDWSSKKPIIENKDIKEIIKEDKRIKVIRVLDENYFSLPMSYNLAFKYTDKKIPLLLKLDADYVNIDDSWINNLQIENNKLKNYCIRGHWKFTPSMSGFLLINKIDFPFYNEHLQGWGYDDDDLFIQLQSKIDIIIFSNIDKYVKHLDHNDNDRTVNYIIKNKLDSKKKNKELCGVIRNKRYFSIYKELTNSNNYIEVKREMYES